MKATAYPGTIVDLSTEAGKIDLDSPLNHAMLLLGLLLLDAEVLFHVSGEHEEESTVLLSQLTLSRSAPPEAAHFLFVPGAGSALAAAFGRANLGTLVDPHLGATLVLEAERIEKGGPLFLSGPGIRESEALTVDLPPEWVELRAHCNAEFPLGVDLFIVDRGFRLVSLPRTIRIGRREEG